MKRRPNWKNIGIAAVIVLGIPFGIWALATGQLNDYEDHVLSEDDLARAQLKAYMSTEAEFTTPDRSVAETTAEELTEAIISESETVGTGTPSSLTFWESERELLAYMVWGEISITDNTSDYYGAYLQACVALNRVNDGRFAGSIEAVIYEPGQFVTEWYEELKSTGREPNAACWQAVDDALSYNGTPAGLIYADSRAGIPSGCYLYYESPTGQRFYAEGGKAQ